MADQVVAKVTGGSDADFEPHPEGPRIAICADVIALGERVKEYTGKGTNNTHIRDMVQLVFVTGLRKANDALHEVGPEFYISMSDRAGLRKFLEQWRGRAYKDDELDAGVPLHKLAGQPAFISVAHKKSKAGRTYAVVQSIMPVPKDMQLPPIQLSDYKRGAYWEERKAKYKAEVAQYRASLAHAAPDEDFDGYSDGGSNAPPDDDLPF